MIGSFSVGVGATLTVTFNGAATSAAVEALIESLSYGSASPTPAPSRTLALNVTDAAGADLGPGGIPIVVDVTGINDTPDGTDATITMLEDGTRLLWRPISASPTPTERAIPCCRCSSTA